MEESRRAVIFANGAVDDYAALQSLLRADDFLVAADGGVAHLLALNLSPHLLVGDMDSLPEGFVFPAEIEVLLHPVKKDQSDLELALDRVLADGYRTIRIAGALGGRIDYALANLLMLSHPDAIDRDLRLDDGLEEVFLIRTEGEVLGRSGDLVSLLPLGGEVPGVVTAGLEYPLRAETLYPHQARSVSNVMTGATARVRIRRGALLCVHMRGKLTVKTRKGKR